MAELRQCEEGRQSVWLLEKLERISMAFFRAGGPDRSEQRLFAVVFVTAKFCQSFKVLLRVLNSQDAFDLLWWEILAVGGPQVSWRLTRVPEICESGGSRMRRPQPSDCMTLCMGSHFGNPTHVGPGWDFPVWTVVAQARTPGYVGRPRRRCYQS